MKRILQIGSAFMGVIIGAGLASGQEILQYFTSFGYMGVIATIISSALFAYLGFLLARLGSRMQATSHKEAIYKVSGWKLLGIIVDYIIIFTLFGVGVVMIAGAGSIFSQQFGLPSVAGIIVMSILVVITIMMNIDAVEKVIGSITPFLILSVVGVSIYSIVTMDMSFAELEPVAAEISSSLPNWFISGINYASFNIAVGASMALLMGGNEKDEKIASIGGLVGGLGIGVVIVLSNLAIFSKIDTVADADMPMLKLVNDISPVLGIVYAVILFGMVFNTAIGMFFAFAARFTDVGTSKHKIFVIITGIAAFILSFVGFTDLVALFYPTIGYMGLFLILALIIAPFRMSSIKKVERSSRESA
ncbi:membrane protein [Virgibacillus siamensis]|uniref:Membrane protein n=1 Tax=Virgibacillus siamensis TaxID=480071 RepID=A0ABP3QQP7_9BACI